MTLTMFEEHCPMEPGGEKREDVDSSNGERGRSGEINNPDGREAVSP